MRQWASPCSSDTSIRQTEWKLAAPLGPYDRALTPPSHSTQAQLLGSLIESQHRKHKALYIRVLSAKAWDGGWAASVLHNRAVTYTSHISYRCVCIRKTYERPHMEYMLNVWAQTPFYSFYSIFCASFLSASALFNLFLISVFARCSFKHTHTDRQGRFDSAGRVKSYFLLCYTFQRKVQSLLLRRRRLRGDFTSKPVEAAFFQTCAVGVWGGILECRGMYLN